MGSRRFLICTGRPLPSVYGFVVALAGVQGARWILPGAPRVTMRLGKRLGSARGICDSRTGTLNVPLAKKRLCVWPGKPLLACRTDALQQRLLQGRKPGDSDSENRVILYTNLGGVC